MREVWFNNQHFSLLYGGDSSLCTWFHLPLLCRNIAGQCCFRHVLFVKDLSVFGRLLFTSNYYYYWKNL